jgi:hypothetical protein
MSKSRFFRFVRNTLMVLGPMSRQKFLFGTTLMIATLPFRASAQSPVFVTQTPISGNSGNSFFVFLPVANIGSGDATNMQVTAVTLSHLGAPATATLLPATLPFVTGSGFLGTTGVRTLDLEFDSTKLVTGNTYLLTLRGTYQVGGKTLGFALNRPVVYAKGFAAAPQQVVETILSKFENRPRLDPQADDEAIVAFANGLPQVASAILQVNPPGVSITFNDAQEPLYLLNNVKLPAHPVLNAAATTKSKSELRTDGPHSAALVAPATGNPGAAPDLPMSSQVRVLDAIGSGFPTSNADIAGWLTANGYQEVAGADASEKSLRTVVGDGVFYFGTHGGAIGDFFLLWTATPWDPACDPNSMSTFCPDSTLRDDVKDGYAKQMGVDDFFDKGIQQWRTKDHFAITTAFIDHYWQAFAQTAFVYIDACSSDDLSDTRVQVFVNEILNVKKASLFAGWTGTVDNGIAVNTSKLVFDRLLGANEFCPEDGTLCHPGAAAPPAFAQRAFDFKQVEEDLPLHGLGNDGAADLHFKPNAELVPATSFGILAPSISNMTVDETKGQGQLTIEGIFGQDPRKGGSPNDGVVTVGGPNSPVKIVSWTPEEIIVNLTSSGPGGFGDVQVVVRQHKSNVARLTEWLATFQGVWAGNDSLKQTINFQPAFRLDLRQYRPVIHKPPVEPSSVFFESIASPVSTGSFACTGVGIYTHPGKSIDTFTWTGSGDLPLLPAGSASPPPVFYVASGSLTSHTAMSFSASAGGTTTGPCSFTEHIKLLPPNCDPSVQSCEGDTSGKVPLICTGLPPTNMTLDSNTAAIQGNIVALGNLSCDVDEPGPSTVSWDMIEPLSNTAPDPLSAR